MTNGMTKSDILGAKRAAEEKIIGVPCSVQTSHKSAMNLESFDDLLKKDAQRKEDGFPKRIKIRRVLAGRDRIIAVPYVEEEKLIHGNFEPSIKQGIPGHGEGEIGETIGEIPLEGECEGKGEEEGQAGEGQGEHGIEAEAYEMGKALSEKFKLPNIKDKGKKVPTDEYKYDLTDRHEGSGQFLDKKATLRKIVKTNVALGRIEKGKKINTANLAVGPQDKIYRVLSREKVWRSQAVVFFLRDYSGSMYGDPTKAIVTQHLMIYAWLLVQYEKLVIPRFIVHDTRAQEVSANDYFRKSAGGGTYIASGYRKINSVVDEEGLAKNYNIYVFQGTDGEDFDTEGKDAIPEIEEILSYANRMGVCVLKRFYHSDTRSDFEHYTKAGGFLDQKDLFRMHIMSSEDVTDEKNIEAIKAQIAQD